VKTPASNVSRPPHDQPPMPGAAAERFIPHEFEAGRFAPRPTILGFGTERGGRATRGRDIGSPVDDASRPAWCEHPVSFSEQTDGILDVEDIEEHGIAAAPVRAAGPRGDEIPLFAHDVPESGIAGLSVEQRGRREFSVGMNSWDHLPKFPPSRMA
jgi:hypothetical protein